MWGSGVRVCGDRFGLEIQVQELLEHKVGNPGSSPTIQPLAFLDDGGALRRTIPVGVEVSIPVAQMCDTEHLSQRTRLAGFHPDFHVPDAGSECGCSIFIFRCALTVIGEEM